jgi:hypothetical protein
MYKRETLLFDRKLDGEAVVGILWERVPPPRPQERGKWQAFPVQTPE